MKHIFTVDVEDWHQAFPPAIFKAHTSIHRLEIGMHLLMDLLETHNTRATFFWFGKYAQRYPALVREVVNRGHELGCHGFGHFPVFPSSREWFYDDTYEALALMSDLTGEQVRIFRAPNFSIHRDTMWALEMLVSLGIKYDSSIFSTRHGHMGIPNYRDDIHEIHTPGGTITEVPTSKRSIGGIDIPATGGGYFRLYPYSLSRANILHHESLAKPVVFYIHPWELDLEHPRLSGVQFPKLLHYMGLRKTPEKLNKLLSEFSFAPLSEGVAEYNSSAASTMKDVSRFAMGSI